jgi:preprotein translocase subunit SecE
MSFGQYFLIIGAIVLVVLLLRYRAQVFKCSWPWDPAQTGVKKYKELFESTAVVIISVVLLAGFVTTSDLVLAHVVGALTGSGIVAK